MNQTKPPTAQTARIGLTRARVAARRRYDRTFPTTVATDRDQGDRRELALAPARADAATITAAADATRKRDRVLGRPGPVGPLSRVARGSPVSPLLVTDRRCRCGGRHGPGQSPAEVDPVPHGPGHRPAAPRAVRRSDRSTPVDEGHGDRRHRRARPLLRPPRRGRQGRTRSTSTGSSV